MSKGLMSVFLARHGVAHRRTRPYDPQINGKVEAATGTIERQGRLGTAGRSGFVLVLMEVEAAARYAGIELPTCGLENLFGLGPESELEVASLPVITKNHRTARLSLAPAA